MTFRMDPTPSEHTGGFLSGDARIAIGGGLSISVADVVERQHRGVEVRTDTLEPDGTLRHVRVTSARRLDGDAEAMTVDLDDGSVVHCSPGQLFLGPTGEWLPANELRPGTRLFGAHGPRSVTATHLREQRAVYEIRVEHSHNVVHPSGVVLHD